MTNKLKFTIVIIFTTIIVFIILDYSIKYKDESGFKHAKKKEVMNININEKRLMKKNYFFN